MSRYNNLVLAVSRLNFKQKLIILFILFFSLLSIKIFSDKKVLQGDILVSDAAEYYSYLPAMIIFNDVNFNFVTDSSHIPFSKIAYIDSPIGKPVIKMPIGSAMVNAPFFIFGHLYAKTYGYESNGYSIPYYWSIRLATLFYTSLACALLTLLLMQWSGFYLSLLTVALVLFGTNLLNYVIYQPGMSHALSFSFSVFFLFSMFSWIKEYNRKSYFVMAFLFGILVLIRPTNIFLGLLPFLYGVYNFNSFKQRFLFLILDKNMWISFGIFFITILPQLIYWKIQTGQFLISTYGLKGESFFFSNPQIANVLFSFRNGWLVYSPLMIFSLIGIYFVQKYCWHLLLPLLIFVIINILTIGSWWCWWFLGYGNRAFIDIYGVLAIPLSFFLLFIYKRSRFFFSLFALLFSFLIFVNLNQMNLYRKTIVHFDSMSRETWLESLLSQPTKSDYFKYMIQPNYNEAIVGLYFRNDRCEYVNEINSHIKAMLDGINVRSRFHENDSVLRYLDFEDKEYYRGSTVLPFNGKGCFKFDDNFDFLEILNVTGSFFSNLDTTATYLKASAWLKSGTLSDTKLANLVMSEGSNRHYLTFKIDSSYRSSKGWYFISGVMPLGIIDSKKDVKVYLWKRSKAAVFVDDFTVSVGKRHEN